MAGIYLTWVAASLRDAGLAVVEYDGWQTRARSSGGFNTGRPWGVWWHHTASNTSPANDANYMCSGSSDRPIANALVARDGQVWVLAAGCTNTNGKGKATPLSRGTVPADSANSYVFGMEIANNGVGEQYPQAQVDAAFVVSNVVNARMGNLPSDVCTHQSYAPDRKIDPATIDIAGSWKPRSCTSSGSWMCDDVKVECERRAHVPEPEPEPEDIDMSLLLKCGDGPHAGAIAVAPDDLSRMLFLSTGQDYAVLQSTGRYSEVTLSSATFDRVPGAEQVDVVS